MASKRRNMAERDSLASASKELEERLCKKDDEMHEKEDELFLQLEKAIRLEEDCEKDNWQSSTTTKYLVDLDKGMYSPPIRIRPIGLCFSSSSSSLNTKLQFGPKRPGVC
ncbi:hypothetical protein AAG570_004676 [Ranatra chinensis]|uniref:Uncharacterized protein n=1 Tax=Ranatra chinensis TaxID=642074 RepID=A0ABD0YQ34_9HEMI